MTQLGTRHYGAHPRIQGVKRHDRRGAGIGQLQLYLALLVERIGEHGNAAGHQRAVIGDDGLRAVGQHYRHPLPAADAKARKRIGEAAALLQQPFIPQLLTHEFERGTIGTIPRSID